MTATLARGEALISIGIIKPSLCTLAMVLSAVVIVFKMIDWHLKTIFTLDFH